MIVAGCSGDEREIERTGSGSGSPAVARHERSNERHPPARTEVPRIHKFAPAHGRRNARLSAIADELLPLETDVRCWTGDDWTALVARWNADLPPDERMDAAGIADLYAWDIDLAPWVCDALLPLPRGYGEQDSTVVAEALAVFVHETRHLTSAGSNEAVAECRALQRMAAAAELFGLGPRDGRELARIAWEEVFPALPPEYRSSECRPGGSLDEEPETPGFP